LLSFVKHDNWIKLTICQANFIFIDILFLNTNLGVTH
jgi:hypothetical protein